MLGENKEKRVHGLRLDEKKNIKEVLRHKNKKVWSIHSCTWEENKGMTFIFLLIGKQVWCWKKSYSHKYKMTKWRKR